ncbi:MAG: TAXI family TRAP transporter solute-binding subunit [Synergistaceae bacterium]|jgi:TRAP transporter TAXI family solute receptor|nr:TAXI family TRAP transporter solute-binding subunit [Synergistaceae bacterium]
MRFKKFMCVLWLVGFIFGASVLLTETAGVAEAKEIFVKIGTGSLGGTYYPVGVAMGALFSKTIPGMTSSAMSSGGTVDNIEMLNEGEIQMAICIEDIAKKAYFGEAQYANNKIDNYKVLTVLWPNVQHIVSRKGISKISDLEGKRIIVGATKSGTEVNAYEVLGELGIFFRENDPEHKPNSIPVFMNYTEGADVLKNRQADAAWNNSLPPASSVMDLLSTGDFEIIGLTKEQQDKVTAHKSKAYFPHTLKANTYQNQPNDLLVISTSNVMLVSDSLDDETTYQLTKQIFENTPALEAAHAVAAKYLTVENAVTGTSIPFCEGAIRYYRERGVWKDK